MASLVVPQIFCFITTGFFTYPAFIFTYSR